MPFQVAGVPGVDIAIAAATAATALFALGALAIMWLAYQHGRTEAGASRSIIVKKPRFRAQPFYPTHDEQQRWREPESDYHQFRILDFYVFNRSAVPQVIGISGLDKTLRIVWPLRWPGGEPHLLGEGPLEIPPHDGGNIALRLVKEDGQWPSEERDEEWYFWYKRRYFIWLTLETNSGHTARYIGWARLRRFEGEHSGHI
jgi:hypothetical protein